MYKIMLVEDEPPILNAMKHLIEKGDWGFIVCSSAQNGKEALIMLEDELPDVIMTDIRMPFVDGLDLIEEVHKRYPHIQCVIITGHSDFEYAVKALRTHVFDYLLKPIQIEQLQKTLQSLTVMLNESRSTAEQAYLSDNTHHISSAAMSASEIVERMEDYLKNNFAKTISYKMFYQLFGYNETYLSHVFKTQKGITPNKYVTKLRIEKAQKILTAQKGTPLKQVALMVGYDDVFYFSRVFKDHTGFSPSDFIKKTHNKTDE